jgi:hypothetical protein
MIITKGEDVISYAPEDEWNFISDWFGQRFLNGDKDIIKEIYKYIKSPKTKLKKFLSSYTND